MSWKERIKEGAITTPDGKRYVFEWDDLERSFEKKTSEYQFADVEGTLVRDFGLGKIEYPVTIYFSGADHDQTADEFFLSAILKGNSTFESPRYGTKTVVIKGSPQRDAVQSAGNQTVFNLAMTETIIVDVPEAAELTKTSIVAEQEEFLIANAEVFEEEFDVADIENELSAKDRFLAFVNDFKNTFKSLISTVESINETFNEISNFITSNIDFLMGAPLQLATSVQRLIDAPARLAQSVNSRIDGYMEGYEKILTDIQGSGTKDKKNQRVEKQLIASSILSAMAQVYLFPDTDGVGFLTKDDAINAALNLRDEYANGQEFLDSQEAKSLNDNLLNRFVVSDAVTQGIKSITSRTIKDLIRLSFSLKQEKVFITDKGYNLLDICYKLYGTNDNDTQDFFIESNGITGEEILWIDINRTLVYYE